MKLMKGLLAGQSGHFPRIKSAAAISYETAAAAAAQGSRKVENVKPTLLQCLSQNQRQIDTPWIYRNRLCA